MGASGQLNQQQDAQVEGGEIMFTFDVCPPGYVWTGAVWVRNVNAAATFEAQVGIAGMGLPIGTWNGSGGFGPLQCRGGERLNVIGFGITLPAGSQLVAYFQGSSDEEPVAWLYPIPVTVSASVVPIGTTTYADLSAGFNTYGDLDTAFTTYADMDRWRAVHTI